VAGTEGHLHPGSVQVFSGVLDAALSWKDVEWLRSVSKIPLVLKGVMNPDDADRAAKSGVAGDHRLQSRRQEPRHAACKYRRAAAGGGQGCGAHAGVCGWRDSARDRRAQGAGVGRERSVHWTAVSIWI
jgi:hypothetical protein